MVAKLLTFVEKLKEGDVVKVFWISPYREEFRFGIRYGIIMRSKPQTMKKGGQEFEVDGYEVLVGSKIEWHSQKSLFSFKENRMQAVHVNEQGEITTCNEDS